MGSSTYGIELDILATETSGETGSLDQGDYPGDDTYTYSPTIFNGFRFNFQLSPGETFVLEGDFNTTSDTDESGEEFEFTEPDWGDLDFNTVTGEFTYTLTLDDLPDGLSDGEAISTSFNVTLGGLSAGDDYEPPEGYPSDPGSTYDTDTIVINAIACFARGTLIATPEGERNVEALKVGDLVTTEDGRAVPVRWIGIKVADPMFNPADRLEPVLIKAGALGENAPHKDLVVTADHGMIVDGHVVDAAVLVGAPGIDFLPWKQLRQTITYYHIETAGHEIVYANNAPAETFIDYTGRRMFDNYAEFVTLYGEENTIAEMDMPRISALRQMPAALRERFRLEEDTVSFNILAA